MRDNLSSSKGATVLQTSSELRTLVKDTVNLVKDSLNGLDVLVEEYPLLQLLLGDSEHPCRYNGLLCNYRLFLVVYEIKCILDDILNAVELLINALLGL